MSSGNNHVSDVIITAGTEDGADIVLTHQVTHQAAAPTLVILKLSLYTDMHQ